jgi:hypothetical protein
MVASLYFTSRTSDAFSVLKSNVGLDDQWEESAEGESSKERNIKDYISQRHNPAFPECADRNLNVQ